MLPGRGADQTLLSTVRVENGKSCNWSHLCSRFARNGTAVDRSFIWDFRISRWLSLLLCLLFCFMTPCSLVGAYKCYEKHTTNVRACALQMLVPDYTVSWSSRTQHEIIRSSDMLRNVDWQLATDISRQPIWPNFKVSGQKVGYVITDRTFFKMELIGCHETSVTISRRLVTSQNTCSKRWELQVVTKRRWLSVDAW